MRRMQEIRICPLCNKPIKGPEIAKGIIPASLGIFEVCHEKCVLKKRAELKREDR